MQSKMPWVIAALIVLLFGLRQDVWNWTNTDLVFGFLPAALFSQACISISAACVWWLAVTYAWPVDRGAAVAAASVTDPRVDPSAHLADGVADPQAADLRPSATPAADTPAADGETAQ